MIMYLILAMFPVIITPVVNSAYKSSINKNDRAKRTFLLCCGVFLFIMIAFRSQYVGAGDSQRYFINWLYLQDLPRTALPDYLHNSEMEQGYLFSIWVLSHIFKSPQYLFVVTGVLFAVSVCIFIYKNSDDPCISFVMFICLGLYTFMVQGLRQAIAMSICLFAYEYVKRKKPVRFILLVLFATLFHRSAILFLVAFLINFIGFNWYSFVLVAAGSGAYIAASDGIASFANNMLNEKYTEVASGGGYIALAIYVLLLGLSLFFAKKNKNNRDYILAFFMTYIGLVTFVLRYREFAIADRVSFYFMFGQMILLPKIIANFSKKTRAVVSVIICLLCIVLFIYRLSSSDLIPFKFFWQYY